MPYDEANTSIRCQWKLDSYRSTDSDCSRCASICCQPTLWKYSNAVRVGVVVDVGVGVESPDFNLTQLLSNAN